MGHSNPCMASLYLRTESEPNIFINDWDMAKNNNLRWRTPPSEIAKSGILGYSEPGIVNVYQPTKFEANIFINDRDIAKH